MWIGLYLLAGAFLTAVLYYRRRATVFAEGEPKTGFSVLIPFRNEEKHLPALIELINRLEYPREKFEVIFIDDFSTDRSADIIRQTPKHFRWKLLQSRGGKGSPKKNALLTGIRAAQFRRIVTWDADARVRPAYLKISDAYLRTHADNVFLSAPVLIHLSDEGGVMENMQATEMLLLMAVTEAGFALGKPVLANGANLQFDKQAFFEAGGYAGGWDFAGGDDLFLLANFQRQFAGRTDFLHHADAVVTTYAEPDFGSWLRQRYRWVKKSMFHRFHAGFFFILLQFSAYFQLIIWLLQRPFKAFLSIGIMGILLALLFRKLIRDYRYDFSVSKAVAMAFVLPFLYLILGIYILFRRLSGRSRFSWKEREFEK